VGNSFNVSPTVEAAPVATTWDGASMAQETPQDPSATFAELLDASCTSMTECVTVGVGYGGTVPHTLIETWDAGTWTVVASPDAPVVTIPPPVLAITTTSLASATPGVTYGPVQLQDAGVAVSTSPYLTSVRWAKGPATAPTTALPRGMTLSAAGVLSGTPNRHLAPGSTTVSVHVTEKVTTVRNGRRVRTTTTVQATIPITVN
jgi:hypothetical protein